MASQDRSLTGVERRFPEDELIVSKTDAGGRITYANDVFMQVCGYSEEELLGRPHSIVRHPQTPRILFRLMWQRIAAGEEFFAYLNNRAKNGDHYWVFAHVTPNRDAAGNIAGFHSNRRVPRRDVVERLEPFYRRLLAEEARQDSRKAGMEAAERLLQQHLASEGKSYDRFVLGL